MKLQHAQASTCRCWRASAVVFFVASRLTQSTRTALRRTTPVNATTQVSAKLTAHDDIMSHFLKFGVMGHGGNATQASNDTGTATRAPCQCEANNAAWGSTQRSVPKCIFVDLGAANANSFLSFVSGGYGPVQNCPSGGAWEAYLVEANPKFKKDLEWAEWKYPGQVHIFPSSAAYTCAGSTTFSIDPDVAHNHWGSSMKTIHNGGVSVTVPTININQLIAQSMIPGDWVMLKIDIEGAEYDLLPCMAQNLRMDLVDAIFVEEHGYLQADSVYTPTQYEQSKAILRNRGISMPDYFSQTL